MTYVNLAAHSCRNALTGIYCFLGWQLDTQQRWAVVRRNALTGIYCFLGKYRKIENWAQAGDVVMPSRAFIVFWAGSGPGLTPSLSACRNALTGIYCFLGVLPGMRAAPGARRESRNALTGIYCFLGDLCRRL